MKTVGIIQARMGSSRLPGKVMMRLHGKTVLEHVISRVRACSMVNEVVVATTVKPADDVVVEESHRCDAGIFRGSEEDVLTRYYHAARESKADVVVRVTSDCPLFDPKVLERLLCLFHAAEPGVDYLSNTLERSYPRGLDAEVFTFAALERAEYEATLPYEREHVTPYLYLHPERFKLQSMVNDRDLSCHRWTLDTVEDLQLITRIYEALDSEGGAFTTEHVLGLLDREPELVHINSHVRQKQLGE